MVKKKKKPRRRAASKRAVAIAKSLKLDLGCGPNKVGPDWVGVDSRKFPGVDTQHDLTKRWPWADASVDEAHTSHFVEHLTADERIHFANELYRVLKPGAQCKLIAPHWCSERAYGDLTHQWPPICEMWFYYLHKAWREQNAPHNDRYTCNFDATWGYSIEQSLLVKDQENQMFALKNYKGAAQDIVATLTKIG